MSRNISKLEISGNIWKYLEISGNVWKYLEISRNNKISRNICLAVGIDTPDVILIRKHIFQLIKQFAIFANDIFQINVNYKMFRYMFSYSEYDIRAVFSGMQKKFKSLFIV